jgi:hypothetical protein
MQIRAEQDQKLAESKDQLLTSAQKLVDILSDPIYPDNMILRQLSFVTQHIGIHHSHILDSNAPD